MKKLTAPAMAGLAACLLAACASKPAPEPPPPPPPPPAPIKETLSGDALFAFGRASIDDISTDGRAQLDTLAQRILALPAIDVVHVIGHSDRIGQAAANVTLSNRRANAVKGYLVQAGVPEQAITAVGRGAVEPVVECEAGDRGQALIDCLAPNRRVEVQVKLP